MIVVELNEFSTELFERATNSMRLPSIERLLAMRWSKTVTQDKYERNGLDPWVQWVSVHTGLPSDKHGIEHLGDVSKLHTKQLWEVLSDNGVSSGVWGAMNARRGSASNCLFFLPDPWTFSERAFPEELNDLLALPRYYSKNYLHLKLIELLKNVIRILKFLCRFDIFPSVIRLLPVFLKTIVVQGVKNYVLFSLFDLINATLFRYYHQKYKPEFSIVFLNSIAHVQHHHWTNKSRLSKEIQCAMEIIDRVLSIIFDCGSAEEVVFLNALTQIQSYDDADYLYRQIDPQEFLYKAGIKFSRIEQLMTNDAHVFFDSKEDMEKAFNALSTASIGEKNVFDVKKYSDESTKVFYQFDYWGYIGPDAKLEVNGKSLPFFEIFESVVRRSGKHVPRGDIFSSSPMFADKISNHEFFDYVLRKYACKKNSCSAS